MDDGLRGRIAATTELADALGANLDVVLLSGSQALCIVTAHWIDLRTVLEQPLPEDLLHQGKERHE